MNLQMMSEESATALIAVFESINNKSYVSVVIEVSVMCWRHYSAIGNRFFRPVIMTGLFMAAWKQDRVLKNNTI